MAGLHSSFTLLSLSLSQSAQSELAAFLTACGEHEGAMKALFRARERCQPAQVPVNIVQTVKVALKGRKFDDADRVARTLLRSEKALTKGQRAFLWAAVGLAKLWRKDFSQAARAFLECGVELEPSANDVLHLDDVAMAATLCGLAAMPRAKSKTLMQDQLSFRRLVAGCADAAALASASSRGDFGQVIRDVQVMLVSLGPGRWWSS